MIVPFYIPISCTQDSNPFAYSLTFFIFILFYIIAIIMGVRWYLLVILICIFLMVSDGDHLFMCLRVICTFFSECLFKAFTPLFCFCCVCLYVCVCVCLCVCLESLEFFVQGPAQVMPLLLTNSFVTKS